MDGLYTTNLEKIEGCQTFSNFKFAFKTLCL